ncbi:Fanconi anemia group D2 protein homolog, partial [Asparagus officinalis]|uniref:Fanconi anemia group D2 protein homolog n=1 Tax=Asparagus officinalis TaxID=4686 RepID=UPI00098E2DF6
HKLRRSLETRFSSDPSILSRFVSGFSSYIQNPQNLKRVLIPASISGGSAKGESLVRLLLLVGPIQAQIQQILLEKLPEHFDSPPSLNLTDDVARLVINQFRWLDFIVDSVGFTEKLMEVLSISPLQLKKEIIGSLPEIIGDQNSSTVVAALEKLLQEDSEVIVPVLDSFSNLNLDDQLQEQAVTIALSCIRTVDAEHMPHLLRFLLLSATPANVGRIILRIREQLKFVGVSDPCVSKHKKLKGKSLANSTEASILDALRSSLRFKNILCEAILKELKSLNQPRDHKVIDVWFLILIYTNGGSLQKHAEKMLKKKIMDGCFRETLFDQCIYGQRELVKDYFPSFLSVCECLLSCKDKEARDFGIYLYKLLFEEFSDTYPRQEILGALVTHIGSAIAFEVSSALDTLNLLTSKYSEELLPLSSHINGILDYLEGFHEESLHKVYEIFCRLALSARSCPDSNSSSIANELLMIIRKQVSNSDMKYRKMGIIGTLKIVSTLGDINAAATFSSSQKSNCQEALELLKMSLDSCEKTTLLLILLHDELIVLLECKTFQPAIIEWIGKHVGEFESLFLCDLEEGTLPLKDTSSGIKGDLWMNLDGDLSPICLNILPLLSAPSQMCSSSLQILPCEFLLLSAIERLTNQGSLGGIDALLGCPLHLPSPKYLIGGHWKNLMGLQKQIVCFSLHFAINWTRELLNAFITQVVGRVDCITQTTRNETMIKLLKRLRNLVLMECLLNACLQDYPLSLPELHNFTKPPDSFLRANRSMQREKRSSERMVSESTSQDNKRRCKKDPETSQKSNPNEKLRQPTIISAFKRAGVVISQEVNESSSGQSSNGGTSQSIKNQDTDSTEAGPIDISAELKVLDMQRFKFRPLNIECFSMLSFSEGRDSCCSDPAAELPLHLYLLRDFHNKLDYLSPPSKQFPAICSVKASPGYCRVTTSEFLSKIRPLFPSIKKHLYCAFSVLRDGVETCEEHWTAQSTAAGNPDIPNLVFSKASAATFVFKEVLCCYSKMLSLPELYLQTNQPILRDMLEAFQPIEKPDNFVSGLNPLPTVGNLDYLYCGVYSSLEEVLETACSFSFLLAAEVLFTMQSLVNSIALLLEKSTDVNGKNMYGGSFQRILPFLRSKLGLSAHKLLGNNWVGEDNEIGGKNKGDIVQKILQIYLKNSESTSDLLDELACSVLPQVPSCKTENTQAAAHGFPTLCPTMFLTWCRVLHEENLEILNKLVKGVILKSRGNIQREAAKDVLIKLLQSVNIVVSLVNLCKVHDKVAMHAMAVKYGGKFVGTLLKAFNFLEVHFQAHNDIIIQLVKELQKATRIIQALCSEAKGLKRTMVTSKIPATKRSMERFLFHVKALLHSTSNGCTFWMGNLKHKDLYGQVVSSQVYANAEDETMVGGGEGEAAAAHMDGEHEEQENESAREDNVG